MSDITIVESGMSFGAFDESQVFHIEESQQYKDVKEKSVRCCEFLLRRKEKLFFIEAKSSNPNFFEASSSDEKRKKYNEFVDEITEKMRHSLELYASILLKKQCQDGVPHKLLEIDLSNIEIVLVIVVKKAEKRWLEPFPDVFNKSLKPEKIIWDIRRIFIINEEEAKTMQLVL